MKFVLLFLMGLFKSTLKSCFILGFAGGSLLENSFIYLWKKSLYKKERKSAINKKKITNYHKVNDKLSDIEQKQIVFGQYSIC